MPANLSARLCSLALSLFLIAFALPALAGPFEDAVAKFANDDYSDTDEAIGVVASSGNPLAFPIISALQDGRLMADLDSKKVELPTVPTATFFGLLLQLTIEGYFADPMYGGNKGAAAWKMIGFPGADAMYADKIEPFRNKPYKAEPKGIQDLI